MKVLLDSNIIIDVYNGNNDVKEVLLKIGVANLCISAITYGETVIGALDKRDLSKWRSHLNKYALLSINEPISTLFVGLLNKFALSHHLNVPDAIIAATAIHYRIPLFTSNIRDFKFIPNLQLFLPE
jgi:tRNA(fMet)-specific endonuclease VapC